MERSILLKAQHLAGVLSTIAGDKSRVMKDQSDWKLCPAVFHQMNQRLGTLEVDLFASRLTLQLQAGDGHGHGCIHPALGRVQSICQPSLESDRQSTGRLADSKQSLSWWHQCYWRCW